MRTRVNTVCFPDIPSVHSGWHIREPRRRALRREKEPCGRGQGQGLYERKQHGKPLDILEEERKGSRVKGLNFLALCWLGVQEVWGQIKPVRATQTAVNKLSLRVLPHLTP